MNSNPAFRRAIAAAVVFALVPSGAAFAAPAVDAPAFAGHVVQGAPPSPRTGVVVSLVGVENGDEWSSEPTAADGSFRIDDAPDGAYAVVVRDGDRAYLAAERLDVAETAGRPVTLTVVPGLAPAQSQGGPNQGELPRWAQWVIAGGVIVAGAWLVDQVLSDDDENPASPF